MTRACLAVFLFAAAGGYALAALARSSNLVPGQPSLRKRLRRDTRRP
jgi:hypothetical protein